MLKRATISLLSARWAVDLPTYNMQGGSFLPITPGLIDANGVLAGADPKVVLALGPTCVLELPDDTPLDAAGQVDKKALAAMYGGRYAAPDYVPPVLSAP